VTKANEGLIRPVHSVRSEAPVTVVRSFVMNAP